MFTGIVEEVGVLKLISSKGAGKIFEIECKKVLEGTKVGDSVAINGICLTVTELKERSYKVDVSRETLEVSTAKYFKVGEKVNLERALSLFNRLGGHIVMGHVDTIGKVLEITKESDFYIFRISYDKSFDKYVVYKGSIAVDGISLTVNEKFDGVVRLNIIPHTYHQTNLKFLKTGDYVNIEFDILAKYLESLINVNSKALDENFLASRGFTGGKLL